MITYTNLQRSKAENHAGKPQRFQELTDFPTETRFNRILPALILHRLFLAELRRGRQVEPHTLIGKKRKPMGRFSHGYHGQRHCSWARTHDDDGDGVAQHDGHSPNVRLIETCSLGLQCTSLILAKVSADQYHVTISQAQVYSSSRSRVF